MGNDVDEIRGILPIMFCKRCGTEITKITRICPMCGSNIEHTPVNAKPPTAYGAYTQSNFDQTTKQPNGYGSPYSNANNVIPPLNEFATPPPSYQNAPLYPQDSYNSYTSGTNNVTFTNKNDTALVTEILLSLIGVFGVGWIIARETTIGIILLVCSFLIYWPIMILGTIFTWGVGLICLGPIAIVAIIINFVLLNSILNRRATQIVITQQPPQNITIPPQQY